MMTTANCRGIPWDVRSDPGIFVLLRRQDEAQEEQQQRRSD